MVTLRLLRCCARCERSLRTASTRGRRARRAPPGRTGLYPGATTGAPRRHLDKETEARCANQTFVIPLDTDSSPQVARRGQPVMSLSITLSGSNGSILDYLTSPASSRVVICCFRK